MLDQKVMSLFWELVSIFALSSVIEVIGVTSESFPEYSLPYSPSSYQNKLMQ